jgi:uncharacterized oligopeptide transporter (OPT) family protein
MRARRNLSAPPLRGTFAVRVAETDNVSGVVAKLPGTREFTLRAVVAGMVVAVLMGASYPYIVLKLGFGPNVSVVAAFFGYLSLGVLFRNFNRWENNIVQTAGTSAAQTAFMCVILAAFDLLKQSPIGYTFSPTPLQSFFWLATSSILGLLLAVPLRQHYVVDENLTYADGVAAAETIIVLDSRGKEARDPALALAIGTILSGLLIFFQLPWGADLVGGHGVPEIVFATLGGLTAATAGAGISVSLLSIGSGMIVGNRINVSMFAGAILSWVILPRFLVAEGIIQAPVRAQILRWVMWPGTAMIICAGLTSLALKWRTLMRTFTNLKRDSVSSNEFPIKWVGVGVVLSISILLYIQHAVFALPVWMTLISALLSLPLMLVGLRVLGETNWGPISQLTNLMQAVFAVLAPGDITANLAASGTTGTIAVQSEAIMQDYKAGHIIGSTPKYLTYSQLLAAPVGAATVAWVYPLLRKTYGIGGSGLTSPISQRVAGFAEFLTKGGSALGKYALEEAILFAVLGVVIALLEGRKGNWRNYLPSPTGIGIGMLVPGAVVFTMVLGGLFGAAWGRVSPSSSAKLGTPLASGFIAGEAIVAVVIPLLIAFGLLLPR